MYFELSFAPNVFLVSTVRCFVMDFYAATMRDGDIASRLALATHELLENAVKYAADQQTSIRIDVDSDPQGMVVRIRTRNRAAAADLAVVRERMAELVAAEDAVDFYAALIERAAKRNDGSGLGLGRVRAEAEMDLDYAAGDDGILSIDAVARIPAEAVQ